MRNEYDSYQLTQKCIFSKIIKQPRSLTCSCFIKTVYDFPLVFIVENTWLRIAHQAARCSPSALLAMETTPFSQRAWHRSWICCPNLGMMERVPHQDTHIFERRSIFSRAHITPLIHIVRTPQQTTDCATPRICPPDCISGWKFLCVDAPPTFVDGGLLNTVQGVDYYYSCMDINRRNHLATILQS